MSFFAAAGPSWLEVGHLGALGLCPWWKKVETPNERAISFRFYTLDWPTKAMDPDVSCAVHRLVGRSPGAVSSVPPEWYFVVHKCGACMRNPANNPPFRPGFEIIKAGWLCHRSSFFWMLDKEDAGDFWLRQNDFTMARCVRPPFALASSSPVSTPGIHRP